MFSRDAMRSHEDEEPRRELGKHLIPLERLGLSFIWHDRKIAAGKKWTHEIHEHLDKCQIILLLVSADFMASDYCYCVEMEHAMKRHETGKVRVIPIILRSVDWHGTPFSQLQVLPEDGKPVYARDRDRLDEAFFSVAKGIRKVVEELLAQTVFSLFELQKSVDSRLLQRALLNLNYLEQGKVFWQFRASHRVGAFLIHGDLEHGQRWLLNRLVMQVSGSAVGKPAFKFDFQRQVGSRSLEALWRGLRRWLDPRKPAELPLQLVEQVHGLWQHQTVILILDNLDMTNEQCIQVFIKEFWEPLADLIQSKPATSQEHYLLMFLKDNIGCTQEWNIPFAHHLDETWTSRTPVRLKKITPFTESDLSRWIDHEMNILPPDLNVPALLADTQGGIPQIVLENICKACGHELCESENVWLKY